MKDLKNVMIEAVNEVFSSPKLRKALENAKNGNMGKNLRQTSLSQYGEPDYRANGEYYNIQKGMESDYWMDKITDDMIDVVGHPNDLIRQGFKIDQKHVIDPDGDKRYAIRLRNGNIVLLGKSPEIKEKIRQLATNAFDTDVNREKKRRGKMISNQYHGMTPKAYAAREYRTNPYPWLAKQGKRDEFGTPYSQGWPSDARAKAMDNIRNGKDSHGISPSNYMNYLNNENKQMKKQLIKITESDLTNLVTEAYQRIKEAYFPNEYDQMLNPPTTYYYNKDTQEITNDVNGSGVWVEFIPNEYSNHGFKVKSAFIDREDGTEEEAEEETALTPEEINYIKNWLENNG